MGEPTDMQMDFEGAIMLDISPMIADVNPNNPIVLKLNRCQNEERLAAKLTMDKMMREQMMAHQNQQPNRNNMVRGKCKRCGQVADLPIVNGQIQPCKECQIIDSHLKSKPEKEETVIDLSDTDRKLIETLINQDNEKKKPIRKKRPAKPKGDDDVKNNV